AKYNEANGNTAARALGDTLAHRNGYVNSATLAVIVGSAVQYLCNRKAPTNEYFDYSAPLSESVRLDGACGHATAARVDYKDVIRGFGRTKTGKPFCNY
ncbi:hypothetical protein EXIGLDRAFT_762504, partial [Exidia glandulosa HHB12029]